MNSGTLTSPRSPAMMTLVSKIIPNLVDSTGCALQ
jgi:hypothetical protein